MRLRCLVGSVIAAALFACFEPSTAAPDSPKPRGQITPPLPAAAKPAAQAAPAVRVFGEANTARFDQRMADMDREQRIRVDTIRGESKYVNPTTGQRVKVEVGYKHVYNSQAHPNLFLATDTAIDPGALDWQELQKVQLENY